MTGLYSNHTAPSTSEGEAGISADPLLPVQSGGLSFAPGAVPLGALTPPEQNVYVGVSQVSLHNVCRQAGSPPRPVSLPIRTLSPPATQDGAEED